MVRWVRTLALGFLVLALLLFGVAVGLFLHVNDRWVGLNVHEWLHWVLGATERDVWLPGLLAGWLAAVVLGAILLSWSLFYAWRRRQYEALITRLERELSALRNMPFESPAPFEDLPEAADPAEARMLAATERSQLEA